VSQVGDKFQGVAQTIVIRGLKLCQMQQHRTGIWKFKGWIFNGVWLIDFL